MRHDNWEPPAYQIHELLPRRTACCIAVVVLNEGERLRQQLQRMREYAAVADIIVADGGSVDGSTELDFLGEMGVRALLVTAESGLSTATRMAYAYALEQGYEGVITVDGNGKDGVEAVSEFVRKIEEGFDLIQGSRFLPGGHHAHTPLARYIGIRYVLAVLVSAASGVRYTDPTNAFRGCSRQLLLDPRVQPVRKVFVRFNIHHYLIYRAAKLGLRVTEIPVKRVYPAGRFVPTKVRGLRLNLAVLWEMILAICGFYNPPRH